MDETSPDAPLSLWWYDLEGNLHNEIRNKCFDGKFRSALERLIKGPAAQAGIVTKVLVTDSDDFTNFLWEKGRIVFPSEEDSRRGNNEG